MTLALATLGELPEDGAAWDARRDARGAAARGRRGRSPPEQSNVPAFMRNYDMRWALRAADGDGAAASGGWIRTQEPRLLDAPLVAAMTDAWAPAAFVALGRFVAAPTLDLTIHIRRPLPPAGMTPRGPRARPLHEPALRARRVGGGRRAVDAGRRADRAVAPARAGAGAAVVSAREGYLGLGSNVGDRRANLQAAVDALGGHGVEVLASSSGLRHRAGRRRCSTSRTSSTPASAIRTALEPEALLDACKAVERELGRAAGGVRHGPRPIDVDLLLLGDETVPLGAAVAAARAGHEPALRARRRCSSSRPSWSVPGAGRGRRRARGARRRRRRSAAPARRSRRDAAPSTRRDRRRRSRRCQCSVRCTHAGRQRPAGTRAGIRGEHQRRANAPAGRASMSGATSSTVSSNRRLDADLEVGGVRRRRPARRPRSSGRRGRGDPAARSGPPAPRVGRAVDRAAISATSGALSRATGSGTGSFAPSL